MIKANSMLASIDVYRESLQLLWLILLANRQIDPMMRTSLLRMCYSAPHPFAYSDPEAKILFFKFPVKLIISYHWKQKLFLLVLMFFKSCRNGMHGMMRNNWSLISGINSNLSVSIITHQLILRNTIIRSKKEILQEILINKIHCINDRFFKKKTKKLMNLKKKKRKKPEMLWKKFVVWWIEVFLKHFKILYLYNFGRTINFLECKIDKLYQTNSMLFDIVTFIRCKTIDNWSFLE